MSHHVPGRWCGADGYFSTRSTESGRAGVVGVSPKACKVGGAGGFCRVRRKRVSQVGVVCLVSSGPRRYGPGRQRTAEEDQDGYPRKQGEAEGW